MIRLEQDGNDAFLVMDDSSRWKLVDASVNFNLTVTAALENGLIVPIVTALQVAKTEREYWKQLAEKRGEELANIRSGQ